MPKVGMQPIRKRQLIEATVAAIHAYGLDDATVARIAGVAGLSPGIIAHYFGGKDALLEATMRHLLTELLRDVTARLAEARTPLERVEAVVAANFGPEQFTSECIASWFAFWSQAPRVPELDRLNRVYMKRTRSNLCHALKGVVSPEAAARIAGVAACLIDGIWVRTALTQDAPDSEAACATVMGYVRTALAEAGRADALARAEEAAPAAAGALDGVRIPN